MSYDPMITESDSKKILAIQTRVLDLTNDVAKLMKIVVEGEGDKQLPLVEKVRNHEEFIRSMRYWGRFLVGALILQTLAFLSGIMVALIKFLPVLQRLAEK